MTHKEEIYRWANSPDGTQVWSSGDLRYWKRTKKPSWKPTKQYIVDDRHAEIRKLWFYKGRPQIQVLGENGTWLDVEDNNPSWDINREYRIKPKEWYKDIPAHGVLCWIWDKDKTKDISIIMKYNEGNEFPYEGINSCWEHAEPLVKEEIGKYIYSQN